MRFPAPLQHIEVQGPSSQEIGKVQAGNHAMGAPVQDACRSGPWPRHVDVCEPIEAKRAGELLLLAGGLKSKALLH